MGIYYGLANYDKEEYIYDGEKICTLMDTNSLTARMLIFKLYRGDWNGDRISLVDDVGTLPWDYNSEYDDCWTDVRLSTMKEMFELYRDEDDPLGRTLKEEIQKEEEYLKKNPIVLIPRCHRNIGFKFRGTNYCCVGALKPFLEWDEELKEFYINESVKICDHCKKEKSTHPPFTGCYRHKEVSDGLD